MEAARPVRVHVLGELRVECGDDVVRGSELASFKGRVLLAALALSDGAALDAAQLAERLWPDGAPDSAEATIASLVSRLRAKLGQALIVGNRSGYRIGRPPDVDVDLSAAERYVREAQRRQNAGQPGLAVAAAQAALTILQAGPVALDDAGGPWAQASRDDYAALLRRARQVLVDASLATGDLGAARQAGEAAVAADALDEQALRGLLAALVAQGEVGAALGAYETLRRALAEQLGADPAPATQQLHATILRGTAEPRPHRAGSGPARLGLAGRDTELARLHELWAAAAGGDGALVVLVGEAGAGKTRLAQELAAVVEATGGAVLAVSCHEAEKALFLQPVCEAIASAASTWPVETVRAAATDHVDALARLVPEVRAATGITPSRPGLPDVERRRSMEATAAFICGLAAHRALLLVLDDLHNAGSSTVELLHYLRTRLPAARVLVLATLRSSEGITQLAALGPVAHRIDVGALPLTAVHELAAQAGHADRAAEITRRTGGHALFVVEMLRSLSDSDALPESLQAAVLARLAGLPRQAQDALRAGAVLGAAFEPRLAAELIGAALAEVLTGCERAAAAGLLVDAGTSYQFANDVLREVVYASTPGPARSAYHRRAVDLLSAWPEQVGAHAVAVEDWPRASRAWLVAAEQALERLAAADAVELASQSLLAAQRAADTELFARALLVRGRACYVAERYVQACEDLGAAVAAAREVGDRRLEMIALREQSHDPHVAMGRPPADSEAPMRECLRLAEALGDRTREADALGRLAILAMNRLDFVSALELAGRALQVGRASGQSRALIFGLDATKAVYAYLGEVPALAEVIGELEPLVRADGDLLLLQWAVFESFVLPASRGDYPAAIARLEAALALTRRSGLVGHESFFVSHLGWLHRLAGDLPAAASTGERAVDLAREHHHPWGMGVSASIYATTLLTQQRRREAAELLDGVLPLVSAPGGEAYQLRCVAALAAATGSADLLADAETLLQRMCVPNGSAWLLGADVYLNIAHASSAHGDHARSREILAPFAAAAHRVSWTALTALAAPAEVVH